MPQRLLLEGDGWNSMSIHVDEIVNLCELSKFEVALKETVIVQWNMRLFIHRFPVANSTSKHEK